MTPQCTELVVALHGAVLDRGGWPLMRLMPNVLAEDFYLHARALHLGPHELSANGRIRFSLPSRPWGGRSTASSSSSPTARS